MATCSAMIQKFYCWKIGTPRKASAKTTPPLVRAGFRFTPLGGLKPKPCPMRLNVQVMPPLNVIGKLRPNCGQSLVSFRNDFQKVMLIIGKIYCFA